MDTDDLSEEAYEAVIAESDRFHEDLTLQFGLLAEDCMDEKEYLEECRKLIFEIRQLKQDELEDIFFEDIPPLPQLRAVLDKLLRNIDRVINNSIKK